MPAARFVFVLVLSLSLIFNSAAKPIAITGNQAAQRDPQAVVVLSQALNAGGGASSIALLQDFVGTGKIIYFWADEEVPGTVTVKGRGLAQFRLDATLADGVRSFIVNNGTGSLKELDGTINPIPDYQALNFGSSVLAPLMHLEAALDGKSASIIYQGLVQRGDSQVHAIRLQGLAVPADIGLSSSLAPQDFFIDPASFQITSTEAMAYAKDGSDGTSTAEIRYSDFHQIKGLSVPFSITAFVDGQRTFAIQLTQLSFNNGLADSDFKP